ncbi:MAG: hypothetical protein IJP75_03025 [Bacteroidaceae bacterium]|nr:hypothetical protein [Bacteroidaceae bacterium]
MDREELLEIFKFLQKAGANPQLCDTEVPYFETSVRAGLPTENWAEEAFVEMMSLPRKMLASTPAMILDVDGDSMVDAGISDGDRVLVMVKQRFRDGDIVVARIDDGYTVKCYYEDDEGKHWLVAQNREKEDVYRPILLEEQENVQVYGVVTFVMRSELRVPTRNLRRLVSREKEERRKNEEIPDWKVRKAIREIAGEIEVSRLWFAVYKMMVDLSVVDDGDVDGFCQMVREEVPNHGHLPVTKDLQRLEVDSFARSVVLWDEKNAPVKGTRFKQYKEIARKTEILLMR